MALSYTDKTQSGSATSFTFDFPYLDISHVKALVNDVATTAVTIDGKTSGASSTQTMVFATAPADGATVRIYRETPGGTASSKVMLVDFQDGSVLTQADLDKAYQQILFLAQENIDDIASTLGITSAGNIDAGSRRIVNLGTAVDSADAVTKSMLDASISAGAVAVTPQQYYFAKNTTLEGITVAEGSGNTTLSGITAPNADYQRIVCTIGGVVQRPVTDFTITSVGSTYTLNLLGISIAGSSSQITVDVTLQVSY